MPTLNLQVAASTDDTNHDSINTGSNRAVTSGSTSAGDLTNTVLSPGSHGTSNSDWSCGARFNNVTIPQGATITSALYGMTPQTSYTTSGAIDFHVSGQAADNPVSFSVTQNLTATNRPRTTAVSGPWDQNDVSMDVPQTIDVTAIIQEIINRPSWVSGNSIVILVDTASTTAANEWQDYYSYDGTPAKAPTLVITYGGAPAGITGTAALTQGAETLSATGAVAIAGSAALTQGAETLTASGAVAISGSAALTQNPNTLSATGVTVAGPITGSAALTQGAETLAATGAVAVAGSAALTQGAETLASAGAVAVQGSAALTQGAHTLAAAGGSPNSFSITEVAAGEGYSDVSPKQLVRTAGNVLYIITSNADNYPGGDLTNRIRVVKGDQTGLPTSFTEQDVANRPTGGIAQWGAAIDSTGIIHIIYSVRGTPANSNIIDIQYVTFNTATDTYGTSVSIDNTVNFTEDGGNQGHESVSIAIDASDFPHIVYLANVAGVRRMRYRNKTSGSWSAATTIDDQTLGLNQKIWHPNLVFDVNGRILFQWHIGTFNDAADGQMWIRTRETNGTLNAGVAVSAANALLTGIDNTASMMVTADNRYHVTWMNGSTTPANKYIRYAYSDNGGTSWTRNDPGGGVQATHNPSLGPNGKGGVRIYGHGTPDAGNHGINLYYFDGAGGPATWSSWTLWVNNPALDSSVNTRWSQYHHYKPGILDNIYWNDNYPNFLFYGGEIVIQGAAAITQGAQTLSATGTNAGPITGSANLTQGAETLTATGAVAIAGSASLTQGAETLAASGAVPIAGSAALTQGAETLSASGAVPIAGSASLTQGAETLAAAGNLPIVGSAALTQGAHTISAIGVTDAGSIHGSASLTQDAQTLAATGAVAIAGSAALTEGAETLAGAGSVPITGAGAVSQAAQSVSAVGAVRVTGTANLTQAPETLAAAGTVGDVGITGSANLTQGAQTLTAGGSVSIQGVAAITQGAETLSGAGVVPITGSAAITQAVHTLNARGTAASDGTLYVTMSPVDDLNAVAVVTEVPQVIQTTFGFSSEEWGTVTVTEIPTVISPIIGDPTDEGGVTVLAGALPPGLTFNPTTGAITGTPTKAGTYIFTIDATDSTIPSAVGSRTYTIVVT